MHCEKRLLDYPRLAVKPVKDQPFKAAAHSRREENGSKDSTKFVQLHRNETTYGEAFVAVPDCQEPLSLIQSVFLVIKDVSLQHCSTSI